ncbi:MAG: hypothetical protein AAFP77_12750 [Bacteroidota bacterium]
MFQAITRSVVTTHLLLLLLYTPGLLGAQERIVTLGNTADASPTFFSALQGYLSSSQVSTTVLLTGDYVKDGQDILAKQADAFTPLTPLINLIQATPEVHYYLLPGDRDWDQSGRQGWAAVRALEDFLEELELENLHWSSPSGCPGPEMLELSSSTLVLLLNTQWWNHPFRKPLPADADCEFAEPAIILEELNDAVEENLDKNIIIAGHYPFASQGRYGGEFPVSDYLFPPLWGGIQTAYRQNIGRPEEIHNAQFAPFGKALTDLTYQHEGLLFLSSHEPNQQVLEYRNNYLINSGAPSQAQWVAQHKPAIFAAQEAGFSVIDLQADGRVTYTFNEVSQEGIALSRRLMLFDQPCIPVENASTPPNPNYQPCLKEVDPARLIKPVLPVDTLVVGGSQYEVGASRRFFFGDHYRSSWTEPVRVPLLDLDTIYGGLSPTKRGGGRQTKSVKLRAEDGRSFVFRSVDKDPAGTLNLELRNTIIAYITRDQTSSQHPYGAMPVSRLLDEVDILHAQPELYVLGDIPRLSRFRDQFGGMLGMLEVRPKGKNKTRPGTFGADDIYKSFELFDERYDDQDLSIDAHEFARARLFDILIGDWSKHEDNWKWAGFKQDNGQEIIRPIPRDRDHAFSKLDGFFPWLASRQWAVPNLENFGFKDPNIRSLTFQARHMDRLLLSPLERKDFLAEAQYLQEQLSEGKIDTAIASLPKEVQPISGAIISEKLKTRLDKLTAYAEEYYELHARYVDVVGTNKEEQFDILRKEDGSTHIQIIDPKGDQKGRVLYDRTFLAEETKEIRIYGLGEADVFDIQGEANDAIPIRIIGGPGRDRITDNSDIQQKRRHTWVYEKSPKAEVQLQSGGKRVDNWRDELYYYHRDAYEYNTYLPIASLGFNTFAGVSFGGGAQFTRRSFTRRDYSSKHRVQGSISTLGNFNLSYEGDWHHVLHKWDVLAMAQVERPAFYNFFFGIGNNTLKDEAAFDDNFYLVSLQRYQGEVALRRIFRQRSSFQLRLGYEDNLTTDTEGTILEGNDSFFGTGALSWAYLHPSLELDFRDHPVFPSRGFRFLASQQLGYGSDVEFGVSKLAAEFFFSTRRYPITLATRVGWADTQGETPFYRLPNLGMNEGLRGYQNFRFTGEGYFYYNLEFRAPVALWRNTLLPVVLGFRAFYDSGFVQDPAADTQESFKQSYGGGFYIVPLSRSYTLSVLLGFSEEESGLINVNLGTNF